VGHQAHHVALGVADPGNVVERAVDGRSLERRAIEFFGIRGIGSIYYVAYAVGHAPFSHRDELWAVIVATIVLSIFVHGVTATPVMRELDRRRSRRAARRPARLVISDTPRPWFPGRR